jgi:hypothetical protein
MWGSSVLTSAVSSDERPWLAMRGRISARVDDRAGHWAGQGRLRALLKVEGGDDDGVRCAMWERSEVHVWC